MFREGKKPLILIGISMNWFLLAVVLFAWGYQLNLGYFSLYLSTVKLLQLCLGLYGSVVV